MPITVPYLLLLSEVVCAYARPLRVRRMVKMALPRTKAATDAIVAARRPREKCVFIVDGEGAGGGAGGGEEEEYKDDDDEKKENSEVVFHRLMRLLG